MSATLWTDPDFQEYASIWQPGQAQGGEPPVLGWVATNFYGLELTGTPVHENAGTTSGGSAPQGYPRLTYFGIVGAPVSGTVVFSVNWVSAFSDSAPTLVDDSGGIAHLSWPARPGSGGTSRGVATISATLNGTPSDAVLGDIEITTTADSFDYSSFAWGPV